MASEYHIFNGDQLLAQLSPEITGTHIVIRECLMDGPVAADTLHDFYKMRARFLTTKYPIGTIVKWLMEWILLSSLLVCPIDRSIMMKLY